MEEIGTTTTPTQTITTKQSNALNQKVDTKGVDTFIESSKKILEDQGYTVETKDGMKNKKSLSKYLLVSKGGSKQVVIRVSDHTLPDVYVEKYGTPAVAIDLSARKVMPFDTISKAIAGEEVKVVPQEQSYKASDRLKEFNAIKDNLSDAQLVQYDVTRAQEGLINAVNDEIARRNISVEDQVALGDTPVEKYVAPVETITAIRPRKQSILEEIQSAEQQQQTALPIEPVSQIETETTPFDMGEDTVITVRDDVQKAFDTGDYDTMKSLV